MSSPSGSGRGNAVLSWGTVAAVLLLSVRYRRLVDPLWGVMVALVVGIAVLPAFVHRSWTRTPSWPLLVLAALPLLVRAFGPRVVLDAVASLARAVGVPLPSDLVAGDGSTVGRAVAVVFAFADAIVVATLSVLAVSELQQFTPLRLTVRFASLFVVVATIGFVGFWTVARWTADLAFGVGFLDSSDALMAEFFATTVAALVAGGLFAPVFCRPRSNGNRTVTEGRP